jgi:hypothetical protein
MNVFQLGHFLIMKVLPLATLSSLIGRYVCNKYKHQS